MELIIGLIVIAVVGYFVFFRNEKKSTSTTTSAPYKVEQPVPAADVAPQQVAVEGAGQVVIPTDIENRLWEQSLANLEKEKAEAVKEETPAKKPRKPRATKAEKPAAKKAAPKKAAAIKAKPKATKSKKT